MSKCMTQRRGSRISFSLAQLASLPNIFSIDVDFLAPQSIKKKTIKNGAEQSRFANLSKVQCEFPLGRYSAKTFLTPVALEKEFKIHVSDQVMHALANLESTREAKELLSATPNS